MQVYVINLARSTDRRAHITAELSKTGLAYEIVPAVDGRELDLDDRTIVDPELLAKNSFPAGTAGCALSHLRVYEKVVAEGLEHALILEDDVTLPADLDALVDAVATQLSGAEVALLNYGSPSTSKMSVHGLVDLPSSRRLALPVDISDLVNAAAYVITREACERMLERALPLRANADDWKFFYREGVVDRIRCVLPMAVDKVAQFESTIGLYSLGNGLKGRLVRPIVHRKIPVLHQVILQRRQRILRDWGRSELVDELPFVQKPSPPAQGYPVTHDESAPPRSASSPTAGQGSVPLVIATMHRPEGITGVHTHVRQFRQYLERHGVTAPLVTPFSWGGPLTVAAFGPRLVLARVSGAAGVAWHRYWHEVFLRNALRRQLRTMGECVVYAQGPLAARAALRARRGPHQRVVMAIHFRVSQADEWADKKLILWDGRVFRQIRRLERNVIPQVDGLVPVTRWARDALVEWLPEAATVPYTVIGNFVAALPVEPDPEPLGDLVTVGNLELVKNHRFLLTALAEAKRSGRSYTLDIFGEGPLEKDLRAQARSLGVEEQVRLRGFRRDVREFLPHYRAYVHAAYSESSSLAIMEAMAAGLPIIAGYLEPLAELCDEGVEGRFFPLDEPARAAATFIELLDSEPDRAKAARAANERFQRDFDAAVVAPRLWSFLQSQTLGGAASS